MLVPTRARPPFRHSSVRPNVCQSVRWSTPDGHWSTRVIHFNILKLPEGRIKCTDQLLLFVPEFLCNRMSEDIVAILQVKRRQPTKILLFHSTDGETVVSLTTKIILNHLNNYVCAIVREVTRAGVCVKVQMLACLPWEVCVSTSVPALVSYVWRLVGQYVHLSICHSAVHSVGPSARKSIGKSACSSVRRSSAHPSIRGPTVAPSFLRSCVHRYISPSVCPSIFPFAPPSCHPSVRPSAIPSFRASTRLFPSPV